jgi:hypothetical protein
MCLPPCDTDAGMDDKRCGNRRRRRQMLAALDREWRRARARAAAAGYQ